MEGNIMVYYGNEAKEQAIMSYIRTLSMSQGFYGRLYNTLHASKQIPDDDYYNQFMSEATKHCGSMLEFVLWLES